MAGNQLPVLTLDFSDEKIQKLQEIADKFKNALSIGPGGLPYPTAPQPAPTAPFPVPTASPPATRPEGGGAGGKKTPGDTGFEKFLKNLNKEAQGTLKTFTLINKTLGATTNTLKGLFTTTISWGAKLAAISVAGPFGYGYMAHRATEQYKASQGLGITTGQMQAAKNVYGSRISGTGNILQTLAAAQNDPTNPQYAGLMSLGINPQNGAAQNLPLLMERVASLLSQYKGTGVSQTVLNSRGLGGIIDVATANQLLANSDRLPELNKQYQAQSNQLDRNMGSGTQQSYQDLSARFAYNADRIGNSFLKALSGLSRPIGLISDNLTTSIDRFLNGRNGKALFDTLANGLQKLGNWLGGDDFQTDLKTFADCVKVIVRALGDAIKWIAGNVPGVKIPTSVEQAKNESYFMKPMPGETSADLKKRDDPSLLGFVKASGQTLWGIGKTIGNDMFPDLSGRMSAGGWANYNGQSLPRGLRNNNPGNLNFAGQRGATKENGPNGRFAVFPTMVEGVAALDRQLGLYFGRGKDTISQIVSTYAPGADKNNEAAYRDYLSRVTGLGANEKINRNNTEDVVNLIRGIIGMENGNQGAIVTNNDILAAMAMNRGSQTLGGPRQEMNLQIDVTQKPGSDIGAQVKGITLARGG